MRRELHLFLTAVMFYTRIPCPAWVDHSEEMLGRATKYFPLIGWLAGALAGAVMILSEFVLPVLFFPFTVNLIYFKHLVSRFDWYGTAE